MAIAWWTWALFVGGLLGLLALGLFVSHRKAPAVSCPEAALWSLVWITLGLLFGGLIGAWQGGTAAGEHLAGYLLAQSLAVDNLFVCALIVTSFALPAAYQHRVLFWGVVGAIVLRAACIAAGATPLRIMPPRLRRRAC